MKKLVFGVFILFLFSSKQIIAHDEESLPFLTINGKLSNTSSTQVMDIHPQHIAIAEDTTAETYTVNQPISFQIDTAKLGTKIPSDFVRALHYSWDFGDQKIGDGTDNIHTYTKAGSYILTITANIPNTTTSSVIESVQLNIIPQKPYVLPTAKMRVQKTIVNDPLQDFIKVNFNFPIRFDGTLSRSGSGKIIRYIWDFGDGEKSMQAAAAHLYKPGQSYATPYLRVIDENGLVSDTFVTLTNDPKIKPIQKNLPVLMIIGLALGFITSILFTYLILKKKTNK